MPDIFISVPEERPLEVSYFEGNEKSFTSKVFNGLKENEFFKPKTKSGSITAHDMLIVAMTVISAADVEIHRLNRRTEALERHSRWLNAPMFAIAQPKRSTDAPENKEASDSKLGDPAESGWLSKYLTLRNFLSAMVVLISAIAGFFAWWTQDENVQLVSQISLTAQALDRAKRAEDAEKQMEDRVKFFTENKLLKRQVESLKAQATRDAKKIDDITFALMICATQPK